MTIALNLASAARRALSTCGALALFAALTASPALAQDGDSAPAADDVETGMPLAADALRAELARLELDLATTRDFASAEPALAELMLRVLRAGEFDGWRELLADVHVARVNLLLDMGRVDEAGQLSGQVGAEWGELPASEQGEFRERMAAIADVPSVVAARERVQALHERETRGGADLRGVVAEALAAGDYKAMRELGSLAVPVLIDLLEPNASADRFPYGRDPIYMLLVLEPERTASLLVQAVPDPPLDFLVRVASMVSEFKSSGHADAWVGCDGEDPQFAWVEWLPWFARFIRRSAEHEQLRRTMTSILSDFWTADVMPSELVEAVRAVMQSSSVEATSALSAALGQTVIISPSPNARDLPRVRRLESLDPLRGALWLHPDVRFRRIGAALESAMPDLGELRRLADDPDPLVRERVAGAFGSVMLSEFHRCPRTVGKARDIERAPAIVRDGDAQLLARLAVDPDRRVQHAALTSLAEGRYGPLPADVARAIWSSGTSTVRTELLEVDVAPDAEWLALLEDAFEDDSPAVRLAAAERFGRGDTPSSIELIERLVDDPDPRVQAATVPALVKSELSSIKRELVLELARVGQEPVLAALVEHLDAIDDPDLLTQLMAHLFEREIHRPWPQSAETRASSWLIEELRALGDSPFPEVIAEIALSEVRRSGLIDVVHAALTDAKSGEPSDMRTHVLGLRLIARAATIADGGLVWWAALGPTEVERENARYIARGPDDPLGRDLRWRAWKDLEPVELNTVLDAYAASGNTWIPREVLIDALPSARLREVLSLRQGGVLTWYGWLRLAREEAGAAQQEAIGTLAAMAGSETQRVGKVNTRSGFQSLAASVRAEWLISQIDSGISLETLDRLFEAGLLVDLDLAGEMGGARRRLVESAFRRWGESSLRDPAAIQWRFLSAVLELASSDEDLFTNAHVLELARDERALDACWPTVQRRRAEEFLPLLAHVVLEVDGNESEVSWGDGLAVMRAYPARLVEPMLLDLAERTTMASRRDACLSELEQRARLRDARAAYESRQRDEAAHAQALTDVLALLDDPEWTIRAEAARALGTLGSAAQLPRLIALLRDDGAEVRKAAREAIDRIHGRDAPAQAAEPEGPAEATDG